MIMLRRSYSLLISILISIVLVSVIMLFINIRDSLTIFFFDFKLLKTHIYDFHDLVLVISLTIFFVVFFIIFYLMIIHRKSLSDKKFNFHKNAFFEIFWAIIPCIIVASIIFFIIKST